MSDKIIDVILNRRGIKPEDRSEFLNPDYKKQNDPFLLPDMDAAVARLVEAKQAQENITIYGDYDVDGVTASALLLDSLGKMGFKNVDYFLPDRFIDGYGISERAVKIMKGRGTSLILTVDCGSLNHTEIGLANSLGMEVIVTDHHNIAEVQPNAVAVVNPRRSENKYPGGSNFAGVGVAFKLAQALSSKLSGLENGHEKWMLDLVALGTVCDIVPMIGENRQNVFWGLKVLEKTKRPGLRAIMSVAGVETISTSTLGFVLGPRINSAGRLETAEKALELVFEQDNFKALDKAHQLDALNKKRQTLQRSALETAIKKAEQYQSDNVLVVEDESFNDGIIGIVASGLVEKFKKPVFVISVGNEISKGSARSFGDFSVSQAVKAAAGFIIKGGGHDAAAGVTLETSQISNFRKAVNKFYKSLNLKNQADKLVPAVDVKLDDFEDLTYDLYNKIQLLEPFGPGNEEPIFLAENVTVVGRQEMGDKGQHIKLTLSDGQRQIKMLKFNAPSEFYAEPGEIIDVVFSIGINEWRGHRSVEGRILHLTRK